MYVLWIAEVMIDVCGLDFMIIFVYTESEKILPIPYVLRDKIAKFSPISLRIKCVGPEPM